MEPKNEKLTLNDKIPKKRRIRTEETKGEFDEDGFFTTPNGSFWDMDGEYFNHFGYDIHGGKYIDKLDYIPGPTWIEELGCYPEDKDKYQKEDLNDIDMDDCNDFEKDEDLNKEMENLDIKNDNNEKDIDINDFKKLKDEKKETKEKNTNKKNKKKKKKEESFDEDEWEEIED